MGLIKAALGAAGGVLADQWKEYFICDSIDANVLVTKGVQHKNGRSSNTRGSENIITNGSTIVVNEGQAMAIVDQGKVVEFSAEPGEFTYDQSTEPTIFYGGLGNGIVESFKKFGARFTYGGDTGHDQRVYYFNIKEIVGNKYGTPSPVPFRVVDANIGLDVDISVRCNGEYSYKMVDPILFYTNVVGNVAGDYTRDQIDSQLKTELLSALQPAFGKLSEAGIRYSAVPAHTMELCDALNDELSEKWGELRGLKVVSFGVNSIVASEEDEQMIKDMQKAGAMRDPNMRAAVTSAAAADAMRTAAANEGGAMTGFMGMGMAGMMGNQSTNAAVQQPMGEIPQYQNQYQQAAGGGFGGAGQAAAAAGWVCSCGTTNTGKFCQNCGQPQPAPAPAAGSWVCECGNTNTGKFCQECGKPAPAPVVCAKCGWQPENPANPPKFCPECGNPF
ncbi:MAG: SPFH domain-containing protein [Coriobacteriia bacterium]|nr:SPFH domain-containing protein [Coriobacteriia bacterium]